MRSHQFEIDPTLFPIAAVVLRLHAYIRNRFGRAPLPKKGKAQRARCFRHLTSKPWKRFS